MTPRTQYHSDTTELIQTSTHGDYDSMHYDLFKFKGDKNHSMGKWKWTQCPTSNQETMYN